MPSETHRTAPGRKKGNTSNKSRVGGNTTTPPGAMQTRSPTNQAKDSVLPTLSSLFPQFQSMAKELSNQYIDLLHLRYTKKTALEKFSNPDFIPASCRLKFQLYASKSAREHGIADLEASTKTIVEDCQKQLRQQCKTLATLECDLLDTKMTDHMVKSIVQLSPLLIVAYGCDDTKTIIHREFIAQAICLLSDDNDEDALIRPHHLVVKYVPHKFLIRKDSSSAAARTHRAGSVEFASRPITTLNESDVIDLDDAEEVEPRRSRRTTTSSKTTPTPPVPIDNRKPPPVARNDTQTPAPAVAATANEPPKASDSEFLPLCITPEADSAKVGLTDSDYSAVDKFCELIRKLFLYPAQAYIAAIRKQKLNRKLDQMVAFTTTEQATAATVDALEEFPAVQQDTLRAVFAQMLEESRTKPEPAKNSKKKKPNSASPKGRRGASPTRRSSLKTTKGKDNGPTSRSKSPKQAQTKKKPPSSRQSTTVKASSLGRAPVRRNKDLPAAKKSLPTKTTSSSSKKKNDSKSKPQRK